ncbi:DUF934 domain-containing protein [Aromatoleum petrolei]|uniref:DUF934 domain-containing protein n=1 Tax=Aromatoleum petrolei TaxID=76116 RepID=A0ABX1MSZ9_9RHOO|nr:DUF934 domain-containing protein [Aromatoleum petrolei]NMF91097.1 DUF934 domain-containing protein [Aromatoleum petrolei]QTQ36339.1 putative protein UCP030820 [Aromatoleum petrolei]
MPKLIKNGRIVADDWQIVSLAEGETAGDAIVPAGRTLVPLAVWQARHAELAARADRGEVGVWLNAGDGPEDIDDDVKRFAVIAVNFPKFTDGRGYSTAMLLRTRYGYTGELRAIGDVLRDQFNYMTRSGFDALQPRADRYTDEQLEAAVASISDFTQPYQASATHPQPLFRRVARAGAKA